MNINWLTLLNFSRHSHISRLEGSLSFSHSLSLSLSLSLPFPSVYCICVSYRCAIRRRRTAGYRCGVIYNDMDRTCKLVERMRTTPSMKHGVCFVCVHERIEEDGYARYVQWQVLRSPSRLMPLKRGSWWRNWITCVRNHGKTARWRDERDEPVRLDVPAGATGRRWRSKLMDGPV
jgi:hypothetical protein